MENGYASSNADSESKKRKINTACINCRRRKVKCNGGLPCSNCVHSSVDNCNYTERSRRRKKSELPEKVSSPTYSLMEKRLSFLERAIYKLTCKLGQNPETSSSNASPEATEDGYSTNMKEILNEENESALPETNNSNNKKTGKSKENDKLFPDQSYDRFVDGHTIISILSDSSLKWMEGLLNPNDKYLLNGIRNMHLLKYSSMKNFLLKWLDPPIIDAKRSKILLESPFPPQSKLVFDLIDDYYIFVLEYTCEKSYIRNLFELYYRPVRRKFKVSELLVMTMALGLCISSKFDKEFSKFQRTPDFQQGKVFKKNKYLSNLSNSLFDNAIYYYARVSVISEGITSIRGILLLIFYIESNYIFTHISSVLLSVAVRYSQGIGLHRIESYNNYSTIEKRSRLQVWWMCNILDSDLSFRTGMPPIINNSDVSSLSIDLFNTFSPSTSGISMNTNTNSGSISPVDYENYCSSFLQFVRLRIKCYGELFTVNASDVSFQQFCSKLNNLNDEMFKVANLFNSKSRPILFNQPGFCCIPDVPSLEEKEFILKIQLSFLCHLTVMNRMPLKTGSNVPNSQEFLKFKTLGLDSARTVLTICKHMTKEDTGISLYSCSIFFAATAFLNLVGNCLGNPDSPDTYSDIKLLIEFSMSFFLENSDSRKEFAAYNNLAMSNLVLKIMLNVVIKSYEFRTGVCIFDGNDKLKTHLESVHKDYPGIFHKPDDPTLLKIYDHPSRGNYNEKFSIHSSYSSPNDNTSPLPSMSSVVSSISSSEYSNTASGFQYNNLPPLSSSTGNIPPNNGYLTEFSADIPTEEEISSILNSHMANTPNLFF